MARVTAPEHVYRHDWAVGDLVIWDNTGVLHRVEPYPLDCGRMMHRTSIAGTEAGPGRPSVSQSATSQWARWRDDRLRVQREGFIVVHGGA